MMAHIMYLNKEKLLLLNILAAIATAITFFILVAQFILYAIALMTPNQPQQVVQQWANQIQIDCSKNLSVNDFIEVQVQAFGLIGMPYGAYLGTLLQTKIFSGRNHFRSPE